MLVVFSSIVRVIIDRSLGFAMILSRTRIIKIMFADPNYLQKTTQKNDHQEKSPRARRACGRLKCLGRACEMCPRAGVTNEEGRS